MLLADFLMLENPESSLSFNRGMRHPLRARMHQKTYAAPHFFPELVVLLLFNVVVVWSRGDTNQPR